MLTSMFKASVVTELRFFSKGDVWSVIINFFLAVLGIYSIPHKFSYINKFSLQKTPFHHGTYTMNINKTPKKIEDVKDDGSETVKNSFSKKFPTDFFFFKNKVTNCLFRCLF